MFFSDATERIRTSVAEPILDAYLRRRLVCIEKTRWPIIGIFGSPCSWCVGTLTVSQPNRTIERDHQSFSLIDGSRSNLANIPHTYKSYFLCGDVVVDPVAGGAAADAVPGVVALGRALALRVAGVVADEARAAHQQVQQEAEHLHGDGDQEEDERVAPVVLDEQLGEDPGQRDDHARRAWTARGGRRLSG